MKILLVEDIRGVLGLLVDGLDLFLKNEKPLAPIQLTKVNVLSFPQMARNSKSKVFVGKYKKFKLTTGGKNRRIIFQNRRFLVRK